MAVLRDGLGGAGRRREKGSRQNPAGRLAAVSRSVGDGHGSGSLGKSAAVAVFARYLKRNEENFFTTYGKTGTPGRHMLYFLCKVRRKDGESGKNVFDFAEINGYNGRKRLKKADLWGTGSGNGRDGKGNQSVY